ncbi:hypothetical protein GGR58DRAFT_528110 [Xylaria digitata]|nr:hypothetical protein GGR58DRAFT_528110 [Xylaria digitata]
MPPGSSSTGNQAAQVERLQISIESDRADVIPPPTVVAATGSIIFRVVSTVIDLGLSLLEMPRSKNALVEVGTKFLSCAANFDHIYEDSPGNMIWWVEVFLSKLRSSFPPIVLTNRLAGEGFMLRANWGLGSTKMEQWDPKKAGKLSLNKMIIEHLIRAGEVISNPGQRRVDYLPAYEGFLFIMATTVAHEMVHLFIGFLTGYRSPDTPKEVTFLAPLYNDLIATSTRIGESGRMWESLVFGGAIETAEDISNPLGVYQAGTLYLVNDQREVQAINRSCVTRFLNNPNQDFHFPMQTNGSSISLHDFVRTYRSMEEVRLSILSPELVQEIRRGTSRRNTIRQRSL